MRLNMNQLPFNIRLWIIHLNILNYQKAIDLSSLEFIDEYAKATIELSGAEPGKTIITKGKPIVYGITMPFNGENRENSLAFLAFLFDKNQGLKVIQDSGQPIHDLEVITGADKLPFEIGNLLK